MTPSSTTSYGEAKFWDDRYAKEGPDVLFDWYQRYKDLVPFFSHYFQKTSKLLMSGCGNAVLSEEMAEDGYRDVWNIDISPVVISKMCDRNKYKDQLKYLVMDVRHLEFEDASFDGIIDKGTLDAILCGENSLENSRKMLEEAARILKPGGVYMLITYGDPRSRMNHLEEPCFNWSVRLHIMPRPGDPVALCEGKLAEDNPEYLLKPVTVEGDRLLPSGIHLDSGDIHFIYICTKGGEC